jgi:hypothetical protein
MPRACPTSWGGSVSRPRDVDCSKFDNDSLRRECRERKGKGNGNNNNVDCRKIDDEDLREKCRNKKYD